MYNTMGVSIEKTKSKRITEVPLCPILDFLSYGGVERQKKVTKGGKQIRHIWLEKCGETCTDITNSSEIYKHTTQTISIPSNH